MKGHDSQNRRDPRYERWRWQIFCVTWLAYAGFYLTRKSFSVAKLTLDEEPWNWSSDEFFWADGGYLTAYAVGQFLFGTLGDYLGTRKVIVIGMLLSIVVAVLCGYFPAAGVLIGLLCVQGLCQSTGWAPLAKNVGEFFSQHERGRIMGWWMTNYAIGGFVALALADFAAQRWGWQAAFWLPAAALALVWVIFLRYQVDTPEDVGLPSIEQYHEEPVAVVVADEGPAVQANGTWLVIREVLTSPMVWLLAAAYFLQKPARYLILFWSPVYLSHRLQTDEGAATLAGLFDLAGPFGIVIGGYASDRLFGSRRIPVCVIALVAAAILSLKLDRIPANRYALGAAMFAIGFLLFIPDSMISGTAAIDFGTKQGASTAAGIINGCGSILAIVGGTLPRLVESVVGRGNNVWDYVFFVQAIALFAAALVLLPRWNALPTTVAVGGAGQGATA